MRLILGRPGIARYADRLNDTAAKPDALLTVTWIDVTTLLPNNGSSVVLTDDYFFRLSLVGLAIRKVSPSPQHVNGCLAQAKKSQFVATIPMHTHRPRDGLHVSRRSHQCPVSGERSGRPGR